MARCVELARPGPVLELGAGTGSLTRGLLRAGCPPDRIIALEREPLLAAMLRRDFPEMIVIEGDATRIGEYLAGRVERLCAIVSSLPIKWFPLAAQRAVVEPCLELLGRGGRFLQLTNAFSSPLPVDRLGIAGREIGRVWLNLLPAQIWSYSPRCEAD
jgi:phosphatidylethanolamine/phosphatidyl-N-methylethanolamine N-methyltransferase